MPARPLVRLVSVLAALSEEIRSLSQTAEELQHVLGSACAVPGADPEFRMKAQSMDILTQKLSAISDFVADLSQTVPEALEINAESTAKRIRLTELVQALSCSTVQSHRVVSGEVDIF